MPAGNVRAEMGTVGYRHSVATTAPIVLRRAQVHRTSDGAVTFVDPGGWTVRLWTAEHGGRVTIHRLAVDVPDPHTRISAGRLARLPLGEMLRAATQASARPAYPNEAHMRLLVQPKPPGSNQWGPDHYRRVLAVNQWAREVGWEGGARKAVAEFWNVAVDPTVDRWLAKARRLAAERLDGAPP